MKTKKIYQIAGVLTLMGVSSASYAEMYISPVKGSSQKESVGPKDDYQYTQAQHSNESNHYANKKYAGSEVYNSNNRYTQGKVNYNGDRRIHRSNDMTVNSQKNIRNAPQLPCYGQDVPLRVAMEALYGPNYGVNIEPGLESERISWRGDESCTTQEDVISIINSSNKVKITVNPNEPYIGIASSLYASEFYAHKNPEVWKTDPTKSVSENLTSWAESIGWNVVWPEVIDEIDFESADTVVYGPLIGEGQVFHKVLKQISVRDPSVILSVTFHPNHYAVVEAGGFTK